MASNWLYDATSHTFRNATTGRKLTPQQVVKIRDTFIQVREDAAKSLAERLASGEITQGEFSTALRAYTAETMAAQQALGAGGWESLSNLSDGAKQLQALLDKQVPFMDAFMKDIQSGNQSDDQIAQRAALYQGASVQAYEQANAADAGIDSLPYYPGDWSTECKAGCRCSWEIESSFDGNDEVTYATWQTEDDGAVCDDCQARGNEWQNKEISRAPRTDQEAAA